MIQSIRDSLTNKRGSAEGIGILALTLTLVLFCGMLVTHYSLHSIRAGALQTLNQEVANRAETVAATLNSDLTTTNMPSLERQCSTKPAVCTTVLEVANQGDDAMRLRIQADSSSGKGQTVTKDVTLLSQEATHVTAVDRDGNNVWALSDEGLRFRMWGVATGEPSVVTPGQLEGPGASTYWVQVDDRAGIDSTGALWVWGENADGRAGVGSNSSQPVQPTKINQPGVQFRSVVTHSRNAFAIDSTGALWAWGQNADGELGLGNKSAVRKPTKVPNLRVITAVFGSTSAYVITSEGDLYGAGHDTKARYGQLGTSFRHLAEGTKFKDVAASVANAGVALVKADGRLEVNSSPMGASGSSANVRFSAVARGASVGYALSTTGELYSWGTGTSGQLGQGTGSTEGWGKVNTTRKFISIEGTRTGALAIDVTGKLFYLGTMPAAHEGGPQLPIAWTPQPLLEEMTFRQLATNDDDSASALLGSQGNLYSLGTSTPGLWPMSYSGAGDEPIRMPLPVGFDTYTWQ